jgi:hypothetical protein
MSFHQLYYVCTASKAPSARGLLGQMHNPQNIQTRDKLILGSLWLGIFVPIIYFGMQIVAAIFYPGYSFLSQTASELGSSRFAYAAVFNIGIFILGIVTLVAALGYLGALHRLNINPILTWLIALAVAANGAADLWAATYSLPDPRHGAQPPYLNLVILMPVLLAIALWRRPNTGPLRAYLIATMLLVVALVPIVSGAARINLQGYGGLIQRLFALALFPPIGVGAYFLRKSIKRLYSKDLPPFVAS